MIFSKIFTKKTFLILIILWITGSLFFYFLNKNLVQIDSPILVENNILNQQEIIPEPIIENTILDQQGAGSEPISENIILDQQEINSDPIIENSFVYEEQDFARLPVRIKIPKINVDAILEHVGLTSRGGVDIPEGPVNAAWFKFGPRPGDPGNAIIIGHYGWKNNIVAVFDNIYKLVKGDKVYIEDEDGKIITFIVRESRSYNPEADSSFVFVSNDDKSHLNLITCEGIWNKALKSYSKRLVVFTDRE